jgi:hypothetical protein
MDYWQQQQAILKGYRSTNSFIKPKQFLILEKKFRIFNFNVYFIIPIN